MTGLIDPTAVVDGKAELASGVKIGPHVVIGPNVEIGTDTEIGAAAQVQCCSRIGKENRIFPHSCVGFDPQDLKYGGEVSWLEVGNRNIIREFTTLNRGTALGGGTTRIGDDNLFMAYAHVGHDSQVGSRTVFGNAATLGGHVKVEDDATINAFSSVHPFCRVGCHAYVGGYTVLTVDALPYSITTGEKPRFYGVNRIGLERKGYDAEQIRELERALRLLLRSGRNTTQALEALKALPSRSADIDHLIAYVESSERGFAKAVRRGSRGAASD